MVMGRLERDIKRLRDKTAEFATPSFTYYEQELIRRILKAVISQMHDSGDISVANGILDKTEWLDG